MTDAVQRKQWKTQIDLNQKNKCNYARLRGSERDSCLIGRKKAQNALHVF